MSQRTLHHVCALPVGHSGPHRSDGFTAPAGFACQRFFETAVAVRSEPQAKETPMEAQQHPHPFHSAHHVYFNDGTDEDIYALVLKDNGGENLNLYLIRESGEPEVKNGVPRREKADYGVDGGGDTWHL